jgi:hypothetical protein
MSRPRSGKGWKSDEQGVFWVKLDPKCRAELAGLDVSRRAAVALAEERLKLLQELQVRLDSCIEVRFNKWLQRLKLKLPTWRLRGGMGR